MSSQLVGARTALCFSGLYRLIKKMFEKNKSNQQEEAKMKTNEDQEQDEDMMISLVCLIQLRFDVRPSLILFAKQHSDILLRLTIKLDFTTVSIIPTRNSPSSHVRVNQTLSDYQAKHIRSSGTLSHR